VNKPDVMEFTSKRTRKDECMHYLAWIPDHAGIEGNERADKLAKDMSEDIFKGRVSATSHMSMNSALQVSAEITYNSWQRKQECDRYQQRLHTTPGRGSRSVTGISRDYIQLLAEEAGV